MQRFLILHAKCSPFQSWWQTAISNGTLYQTLEPCLKHNFWQTSIGLLQREYRNLCKNSPSHWLFPWPTNCSENMHYHINNEKRQYFHFRVSNHTLAWYAGNIQVILFVPVCVAYGNIFFLHQLSSQHWFSYS